MHARQRVCKDIYNFETLFHQDVLPKAPLPQREKWIECEGAFALQISEFNRYYACKKIQ